eukprot:SAG31_NODE_18167_length_644_cov_3.284404_2_plen_89_part_00
MDADSVASAVAGALLYNGTACRADGGTRDFRGSGERSVNGEVHFICKYADVAAVLGPTSVEAAEQAGIRDGTGLPQYWEDIRCLLILS